MICVAIGVSYIMAPDQVLLKFNMYVHIGEFSHLVVEDRCISTSYGHIFSMENNYAETPKDRYTETSYAIHQPLVPLRRSFSMSQTSVYSHIWN